MSTKERKCEIITFYSYKGGTERTMALANVACLLAENYVSQRSEGVLMIDWDLEAPALHLYFKDLIKDSKSLDEAPGLIDIFLKIKEITISGAVICQAENSNKSPFDFFSFF